MGHAQTWLGILKTEQQLRHTENPSEPVYRALPRPRVPDPWEILCYLKCVFCLFPLRSRYPNALPYRWTEFTYDMAWREVPLGLHILETTNLGWQIDQKCGSDLETRTHSIPLQWLLDAQQSTNFQRSCSLIKGIDHYIDALWPQLEYVRWSEPISSFTGNSCHLLHYLYDANLL